MSSAVNDNDVVMERMTVRRGGRTIIRDADIVLEKGVVMGLVGPNGAGKSTLISALCGFTRPASGSLRVLGRDMTRIGPLELLRLRRKIALLPQVSEINQTAPLTARDVVALGRAGNFRRPQREDHEAVREAVSLFGLDHISGRPYSVLSGGEQRKVHLARVFVQQPEIMLLDEPMAGLDVTWQETLRREIQSLWERTGLTTIIITHETQHLPEACTKVVLLSGGRVTASGPPARVLERGTLEQAYGPGIKVISFEGRTYLLGA